MRSFLAVTLTLAFAAWPAASLAEPPPVPSVDQYVEVIPTGNGGMATGPRAGATPLKPVPLAAPAREALAKRGGKDAKPLEALATRPEYGAPRAPAGGGAPETVDFALFPAAVAAAADGAGDGLLPVFVGMALIAAATVLAARARR